MLFALANAGVRNVNFHTFNGALYAPVDFGVRKGHFAGDVRPLFYACCCSTARPARRAAAARRARTRRPRS